MQIIFCKLLFRKSVKLIFHKFFCNLNLNGLFKVKWMSVANDCFPILMSDGVEVIESGGGRTNVIGRMMTSLTVCVGVGVGGDETLDGKWVNTRLEGEMVSSGWTIDGAIFCWTGQSNFRPKKCLKKCLKNLNIWHCNSLRLQWSPFTSRNECPGPGVQLLWIGGR